MEKDKDNVKDSNAKKRMTYTKSQLIKIISESSGIDIDVVKEVYRLLERNICELLSNARDGVDVSLRLFEGISIDSTFVPEKEKVNNLTSETIMASSKIKPKANITRCYREKITRLAKDGDGDKADGEISQHN